MLFPYPRLLPGDDANGFTYARSAVPPEETCQRLPRGATRTQVLKGGVPLQVDWDITAAHMGDCSIFLDLLDGRGWRLLAKAVGCGNSAIPGSVTVTLPPGNYPAVLRWYYLADNNPGQTGNVYINEVFNNCADIQVSDTGSNTHPTLFGAVGGGVYEKCAMEDDQQCTGTNSFAGWKQCGAGRWVPKTCPSNLQCYQSVTSNLATGTLGRVVCDYPKQYIPPSTATGTTPQQTNVSNPGTSTGCVLNDMRCVPGQPNAWQQCGAGVWNNKSCGSLWCYQSPSTTQSGLNEIRCDFPNQGATIPPPPPPPRTTTTVAVVRTTTTAAVSVVRTTTTQAAPVVATTASTSSNIPACTTSNLGFMYCNPNVSASAFLQCTTSGFSSKSCASGSRCVQSGDYLYCA
ncbi:hypothetical protein HDV05_006157 [Chytridiales sp. JEL 0842]|nr:hypothetical protein HDV05_006157 [Chytridiales sp. JEL 0842]